MKLPFFNFSKNENKTIELPVNETGHKIQTLARDNISKEKALQIIAELNMMTKQLTVNDLKRWRNAWQSAINIERPNRFLLYGIYDDALIDLHLSGILDTRKLQVLRKKFKIVDKEGVEDPELTKLLNSAWFKKFMSLAMESIFWGHSLIQFGDIFTSPKLTFNNVLLVPRRHVIPEYNVFVKETSDEPKKGFDYTKPPYSEWCLSIGDPSNLGLLLKMCPHAISKKNQFIFWDQFSEIFGMPIRIATTTSRDIKEHNKMTDMLQNMGSAPWGLFPDGTDVKLIETTRGDAYNVYDRRIDRANSEMSKAVLGQTMTTDNGSSKSQSEVHERVGENIAFADADMLKDIINDILFPFLINHSFPLQDKTFDWDETYTYTPTEMKEVEAMVIERYNVDPNYFEEKYGIPIIGIREDPNPNPIAGKKKN